MTPKEIKNELLGLFMDKVSELSEEEVVPGMSSALAIVAVDELTRFANAIHLMLTAMNSKGLDTAYEDLPHGACFKVNGKVVMVLHTVGSAISIEFPPLETQN